MERGFIDLSVIAPCYNEEGNIDALVERMSRDLDSTGLSWELLLVDDGSADRTREMIIQAEAADPRVRGCFHERNQGIVEGWATGLAESRGRLVCTIDADLQYRPEDIPRLVEMMDKSGAELVQGWRRERASSEEGRFSASRMFSALLNLIFSMDLQDNKSGFIIYKREALAAVLGQRRGFIYFQHFPTIAARGLGYKIAEVPVTFDKRLSGASFIRNVLLFGMKSLLDFPLAIARFRLGLFMRN